MSDLFPTYRKIGSSPGGSGSEEVWQSPTVIDPLWDDFLRSTPSGQFQQSSRWAEYKAHEGWHHHRVVLAGSGSITGGFQLLWKKSRAGRIGYVSKGPVLAAETAGAAEAVVELIQTTVRELGLRALILQPPDESQVIAGVLARRGFLANRIMNVIRATLLVNLAGGMPGVLSGMSATARSEVKQATRRGTVIREGEAADLNRFFSMIAATCLRQGTKPNPVNEADLKRLWESLQPLGVKLMLAQCRGEDVAGQLCIPFGERVTIWKKGWNGQHRDGHPNRLLNYAGLEWACARGSKYWDYAALNEGIATTLLAGKPLADEQKQGRDMFHLSFGGEPRLMPESRIWIGNPLLRLGYGLAIKTIRR